MRFAGRSNCKCRFYEIVVTAAQGYAAAAFNFDPAIADGGFVLVFTVDFFDQFQLDVGFGVAESVDDGSGFPDSRIFAALRSGCDGEDKG